MYYVVNLFFWLCLLFPHYSLNAASLDVVIQGISSQKGKVAIALYNQEKTFPKRGQEFKSIMLTITSSNIHHTFYEIPSGNYAAVAFHDENLNKKLDKRFGVPIEAFGFSNGVIPKMGPPKFSAAMFEVYHEQTPTLNIFLND